MKILAATAALVVLAAARPEQYKEQEDFQYSRSSTDEGSKSGYYGAQRGNMGGNYERAHNMDSLAQNQMGSLVRQTEGELGDISNTKTGSVFTSANSRGRYGSGKFDLSNLEGRNFQEGTSIGHSDSNSRQYNSALSQQSAYSSGHRSNEAHSYGSNTNALDQNVASSNLREAALGAGYNGYGSYDQSATKSGYHSQNGYQNNYGRSNSHQRSYSRHQGSEGYDTNAQTRLINTQPTRIVIRPGETVVVPIATQQYDANRGSATFDENAINTGSEVANNNHQQSNFGQSIGGKRYESSYNYKKKWEKHSDSGSDVVPVPLEYSTVNPNSELYDDSQSSHIASNNQFQSSNLQSESSHNEQRRKSYSGYNSNVKSASSQSQYQSGLNRNSQYRGSNVYGEALTDGSNTGSLDSAPKSYQSAYSYHKSWERQGDPYIIVPNGVDSQTSQRLTSGTQGYSANQYDSQSQQRYSNRCVVECNPPRHRRKVRSYNTPQVQENIEQQNQDLGQQTQTGWADLTQQAQTNWGHGSENLQNFGQQSQDQLENLGQQTENKRGKLEDFGHQTQQGEEDLGQQTQTGWKDLTQQTQTNRGRGSENLQNFGQQTQGQLENLGQRTENRRGKLEVFGHQTQQAEEDLGQQTQTGWEDLTQQAQSNWGRGSGNLQQTNSKWEKFEDLGQQTQTDFGEQTWGTNKKTDDLETSNSPKNHWDKIETMDQQQVQNSKENDHILNHMSGTTQEAEQFNDHNLNSYSLVSQTSHKQDKHTHNTEVQSGDPTFIGQSSDKNNQQQSEWHILDQTHKNHNEENQFTISNKEKHTNQFENRDIEQNNGWDSIYKEFDDEDETQNTNLGWGNLYNTYFQSQNNNNGFQFGEATQHNDTKYGSETNWRQHNYGTGNDSTQQSASVSGSQSGHKLKSLWDKINDFDQSSSNNGETSGSSYHFESEQSSSQGTHTSDQQGIWTETQNHYGSSSYGDHRPWSLFPTTEPTSTTTSSTVKPESSEDGKLDGILRTEDVGRGDIGPENSMLPSLTTSTTEKLQQSFVTELNNKRYKTPEEIEVLSLSKVTEKSTKVTYSQNDFVDTNNNSESGLNVLSIAQQKWLDEQRQHESKQHKEQSTNVKVETLEGESESQGTIIIEPETKNKEENYFGNSQQSSGHGYGHSSHTEIEQQNTDQQFVNVGDYDQHGEDFEQQSQNGWGNIQDFSQSQSVWNLQENLQQSNIQHFEQLGRSNDGQLPTQDFYEENHQRRNNEERVISHEYQHLQNAPVSDTNIDENKLKHEQVEILNPIEPTTEKAGFWKSVGNKFSSAKDKVSSWFKGS